MHTSKHDLIILGGGPAGMTAAIYAARANLDVVLIETSITGGLVNATYMVNNFPSYPAIHGMELMEKMRAHVDSLNVPVEEVFMLDTLDVSGPEKTVSDGETTFVAPAIILTTGRQPIPLDVPTEAEEVHFCSICDGSAYKGKRVLVVGGGNSAFDESLYLLGLGIEHITIIEIMDIFFAAQTTQNELLTRENVSALLRTKVKDLEVTAGHLSAALLENLDSGEILRVPVDGIFVFLGQKPNTAEVAGAVNLSDQGYILADEHMMTNNPGVFAAGDVVHKKYRQITTAVSDGTIAALSAEAWLRRQRQR